MGRQNYFSFEDFLKVSFLLFVLFSEQLSAKSTEKNCPSGCLCFKSITRCIFLHLSRVPPLVPSGTTVLDLRFNGIRRIQKGAFQNAPFLRTLLLNNNEVEIIETGAFDGLEQLKSLYVHRNKLSRLSRGNFRGLHSLESLYVHANEIENVDSDAFLHTPNLSRLYLNHNNLRTIPYRALESLKSLRKIRLDSNALNCDCHSLELAKFLQRYPELEARPTDCSYPNEMRGHSLAHLRESDLHCHVPKIMEGPRSLEVQYGEDSVSFVCRAEGTPKPEIIWMHNDTVLSPQRDQRYEVSNNGSLKIKNPNEYDQGYYECIAKSPMGSIRTKRAQLRYRQSANSANSYQKTLQPLIIRGPRNTEIAAGDTLRLECATSGSPVPDVKWSHNGQPIRKTSETVVLSNGDLLVRRVSKSDTGQYTCSASNSRGYKVSSSANVHVRYGPEFTLRPEDLLVREGRIEIKWTCEARGYPKPRISWLKNGAPLKISRRVQLVSDGTVLKMYPLMKQDVGKYTCRAINQLRAIQATAELRISESVSPRITVGPEDLYAHPGNMATFHCQATGDPEPDILWQFNGSPIPTIRGHYEITLENSLRINDVTMEDAGHYSCQAVNSVGAMSADAKLTVEQRAAADISSQITPDLIKASVKTATENVDRAISATRRNLYDGRPKNPAEILAVFRFPRQQAVELARAREIYEETLFSIQSYVRRGLAVSMESEKNISYESVFSVSHLQMIMELSGCAAHQFKDPCTDMCFHLKYRSHDGQCNSLERPMLGASLTPFKRLLPPIYENGFNTPVGWNPGKTYFGYAKPNPRTVSLQLISTSDITPDPRYSSMLMQWGQFIDHDLDFVAGAASRQVFAGGALCNLTCDNRAPCFNIRLPREDPRHRKPVQPCIEFERSSAVCGSGETSVIFRRIAPREQLNQVTAFIDGSQVYGSTEQEALDLRDLFSDHGLLRFDIVSQSQKPYLPFNRDAPMDCRRNWTQNHPIRCFLAGDYRANEQLGLLATHTLWLREHNRIAARFLQINPHWDGEKIYQETRKIIGAQIQHITYSHWLPKILGLEGMSRLPPYNGYNPEEDPSVSNGFATAAFRFGHALVNPVLYRYNSSFRTLKEGHLPLHQAFFAPERLLSEGGIDPILRGLFASPSKQPRPDQLLNQELTEKLFSKAHEVALDLAAVNIQRGRDHALPTYMQYRAFCNFSTTESWDELSTDIPDRRVRRKLQQLYGNPKNIDIWVGGMSEETLPGGRIGKTFACIIADQFQRSRDGDRFWYEKSGVFKPMQLQEIRKTSLASIICKNSDNIQRVQQDVFMFPGSLDPRLYDRCNTIPEINLNFWQDCCTSNFPCRSSTDLQEESDYSEQENELTEQDSEHRNQRTRLKRALSEIRKEDADVQLNIEERIDGLEDLVDDLKKSMQTLEEKMHKEFKIKGKDTVVKSGRCYLSPDSFRKNGDRWSQDRCTSCLCKVSS